LEASETRRVVTDHEQDYSYAWQQASGSWSESHRRWRLARSRGQAGKGI